MALRRVVLGDGRSYREVDPGRVTHVAIRAYHEQRRAELSHARKAREKRWRGGRSGG